MPRNVARHLENANVGMAHVCGSVVVAGAQRPELKFYPVAVVPRH